MNITIRPLRGLVFAAIFTAGCVPTRKYEEAVAARDLYKTNFEDLQHTEQEKERSDARIRQLEAQLAQSMALAAQYRQDIERMKTHNQELSAQYEEALRDNAELLRNHAEEKAALESVLANRQEAVWEQERVLKSMGVRVDTLSAPGTAALTGGLSGAKDPAGSRMAEEAVLLRVSESLAGRLSGLPAEGFLLERQRGLLRLTLHESLLFEGKNAELQADGRKVLEMVGTALSAQPPLEVTVISHSDGEGSVVANWHLSTSRAGALVQALAEAGVPSRQLTAAARGMHRPLVPNSTDANKRQNRRTEIILHPLR
ncbi:MAG: hypothetical protein RLY31_2889 [Bacteroidota bacterium]|jgi:chemotaxis protein MotB